MTSTETPSTETPSTTEDLTPQMAKAIEMGGNLWTSPNGEITRVYLDEWVTLVGLTYERYGTGNIRKAYVNGEKISNTGCRALLATRVWVDADGAHLDPRYGEARSASGPTLFEALREKLEEGE